ncbi:hypothetical protein F66182_10032 [Fusarium sp. NRRL 66182]|nr:hypothetical protein F66182_10032 [Fusarium sp. NRRL 66182]
MSANGVTHYTSLAVRGSSLFFFFLGASHLIRGAQYAIPPSERVLLPPSTYALVDSQLRFLGGIFSGYAAATWWTSNDLAARKPHLKVLLVAMILGGVSRVISAYLWGWPSLWARQAAINEIVLPVLLYGIGLRD